MFKIDINIFKDYWKKASTLRELSTDDKIIKSKGQFHHIIDHQHEHQWMVESLNQLPINYRTVLFLRFYQDLTYAEIAVTMDRPINTIKTWLTRALKQLEIILKEDERKENGVNE